ncbi:hypothetical protein E0Z10_g6743 [Xylaria hypoxylon]|uniref:Hemerythrin-like domain-containing protein n=1 Tax=Xylaria hypoxylon TaxID=37992 RepID=A0A4Z0Z022_9PEZI|nr:hypothetical protein E0Z10_g6743 [Xylaria hypoxylon]
MCHTLITLITRAAIRSRTRALYPRPAILGPTAILLPFSRSLNTSTSTPPTMASSSATVAPSATPSEPRLPPLSAYEFKEYNRLADHMDVFHNHFRSSWNLLYTSASSGRRAQGMSIRSFLNAGLEFISHLEMHHSIEERFVFPELARRMPEFRNGRERNLSDDDANDCAKSKSPEEEGKRRKAAELLQQHVEIHEGMEGLRHYLRCCLSGETELQMGVLKAQLETWGPVLLTHLDQEVRCLGAENMRCYWSLDEVRKMRM